MYCWKCGAHNPDTSIFCFKCGNNLTQGESQGMQGGGQSVPQGNQGADQGQQQPPARPPVPPAPSSAASTPTTPLHLSPSGAAVPQQPPKPAITENVKTPTGIIGNRYRVENELGRGGRGVVFKAFDLQLEVYIALKFLPPELASDQSAVEELKTEAKAAMMLSHPNIVRLHNFEDMGGYKFITMEFINGPTLDEMLMRRKQFTVNEAVQYSIQILDGLDYAHKKGVIHRDMKPSNLMKTPEGTIKLTDYGIASIISDSIKKVSSEFVIGTPRYMSPEQLLGKHLDNRTDLYSFGVVLYEFLTGEPPFKSGGLEYQIINTMPEPIPHIPEKLNYVIMQALQKKREDRWETAKQFSDALQGKIKIVLPHEIDVKEPLMKRVGSSIKGITEDVKDSIKDAQHQARRAKLERRKDLFEKKKKLPGFKESAFFRHTMMAVTTLLFAMLFAFQINVSGFREVFLLGTMFLLAAIFGSVAYSKIYAWMAAFLIPILGYLVSFSKSNTYVGDKGILFIVVLAVFTSYIAWILAHFRLYMGYEIKELWERRDYYLVWFAVAGGLFIIPILEDTTRLGLTHITIFGYVLVLGLFIKKWYNSFIFPLVTLTLFSISRIGPIKLIESLGSVQGEVKIANELIPLSSFKTLIWEYTVIIGMLTFLLVAMSFILQYFNRAIMYIGKVVVGLILIALSLYAYHFWVANDVFVGSKVYIKPGEVRIGTSEELMKSLVSLYGWEEDSFVPELPGDIKSLDGFYIDKYEVTNKQYKEFLEATNTPPPEHWIDGTYEFLKDYEPVVSITFEEAQAYAEWKKGKIPDEAHWMRAARSGSSELFPWGDATEPGFPASVILEAYANTRETNLIGPSKTGWFFTDMTRTGIFDMAGNVMEWVDNDYAPLPGNKKSYLEPDFKKDYHLVKGGSYNHPVFQARVASRYGIPKGSKKLDVGFRCIYFPDSAPEQRNSSNE